MSALRGKCDEVCVVFVTFGPVKNAPYLCVALRIPGKSAVFGAKNRKSGIFVGFRRADSDGFLLAQNLLKG